MGRLENAPWAVCEPGFEPWEGPRGLDDFQPLDTRASDLRAFLRDEVQREVHRVRKPDSSVTWITLPFGVNAQLTRKAADHWELMVHLGRDWFQIIEGRSREEVLSRAGVEFREETT